MPQPKASIPTVQVPVSDQQPQHGESTDDLRPYACLFPGCTQRFKRKYTLKDHMNMHTGEKPFVCPVRTCRKTFTTSGNLARHKRIHPWLDAPLPCLVDGCRCAFPTEAKLERHMLSHFDASSVHRCEFDACGRVFCTPGNLRRHWKKHHSAIRHVPAKIAHTTCMVAPLVHTDAPCNRLVSSDHELLDILACLFDDHEAGARTLPVETVVNDRLKHEGHVCRV